MAPETLEQQQQNSPQARQIRLHILQCGAAAFDCMQSLFFLRNVRMVHMTAFSHLTTSHDFICSYKDILQSSHTVYCHLLLCRSFFRGTRILKYEKPQDSAKLRRFDTVISGFLFTASLYKGADSSCIVPQAYSKRAHHLGIPKKFDPFLLISLALIHN